MEEESNPLTIKRANFYKNLGFRKVDSKYLLYNVLYTPYIYYKAGTYYYDFLPNGENDFIKYSDGKNGKSEVLNSIDIPVLAVFGSKDECVLTEPIDIVKEYLKNNINNCNVQVIEGANHSYTNKYKELGDVIINNSDKY